MKKKINNKKEERSIAIKGKTKVGNIKVKIS
jgi:hypothetical protein